MQLKLECEFYFFFFFSVLFFFFSVLFFFFFFYYFFFIFLFYFHLRPYWTDIPRAKTAVNSEGIKTGRERVGLYVRSKER